MAIFCIYFLYSSSSDKYYIGYSDSPERRSTEHNSSDFNSFTKKHRPWILAYSFQVSESRGDAIKIERFIKKQKSRKLVETIITDKRNIEHFKWILEK